MSTDTQTPAAPSGLRIREIKTRLETREEVKHRTGSDTAEPIPVPELDEEGREIELSSVDVPQHVEHEGADAITEHHAKHVEEARAKAAAIPPATTRRARPARSKE